MVQMLFFLRFRSQLRRTRPDLVTRLDEIITGAIFAAGGRLSDNRRFLNASFDSGRVGFWLEILILIETIQDALENAGAELSGHALVFNQDIPEQDAERLCRTLSSGAAASHTGVWCGQAVRDFLQPYCVFEKPFRGFVELIKLKSFNESGPESLFPYREKIMRVLDGGKKENTLLLGSSMGIRDRVYQYCSSVMKEIPSLIIRFNSEDCGPRCFCDALTPQIRAIIASSAKDSLDELDSLGELLFRERLRDQVSPFIIEAGKRFLALLLQSYRAVFAGNNSRAVVVLEDPLAAGENSMEIFMDVVSLPEFNNVFLFIGVNTNDNEEFREWNNIFSRVLKFAGKDFPAAGEVPELPGDLWEMLYAFYHLRRFFPPALFPRIFEEEGLNPAIPDKALELLLPMGAIDSVNDPRPCFPGFPDSAEKKLGERKSVIRTMVVKRLLAWEKEGRIRPCFNLLCVLNELGGDIDD